MKDYYRILGVKPEDSDKVIKKAYRKLAKGTHPDKGWGTAGEEWLKELNVAYDALKTPEARKQYDSKRNGGTRSNPGGQTGQQNQARPAGTSGPTPKNKKYKTYTPKSSGQPKAGPKPPPKRPTYNPPRPSPKPPPKTGPTVAPRAQTPVKPASSFVTSVSQTGIQIPNNQTTAPVKNWPEYKRAGLEPCTVVLFSMVAATGIFGFLAMLALIGSNPNLPAWSYAIVFILVDVQGLILLALTPVAHVAIISASVSSVSGFGLWTVVGYNMAKATIHVSLSSSTAVQVMAVVLVVSSLIWLFQVRAAFIGSKNTI